MFEFGTESEKCSLILSFRVNSRVSALICIKFPFVEGQNFGPLHRIEIWEFVKVRLEKLKTLGCNFEDLLVEKVLVIWESEDCLLVGSSSFLD